MESAYPLASSSTSYNIFNLSDEALREKLEFKEEVRPTYIHSFVLSI